MFRTTFIVLALFASSATAFTTTPRSVQSSALFSKADIPDAVAQGPEEGQIPAAENNKKGEKTMESLANQGNKEDNQEDK